MKCHICKNKAVINLRHHNLALCKDDLLKWVPKQVQRTIEKYHMFNPQDKILVAVSGGKDSLSLWNILIDLGYKVDGLYIDLGIDTGDEYSKKSREFCNLFAIDHGVRLHIFDIVAKYGVPIRSISTLRQSGRKKPCSVCGLMKRYIMNHAAVNFEYDVLVTGHNLDDEVAILFGNTLNWAKGYISRQDPVLEATVPGFVRKTKPLCRIYERETAAYAISRGIDYIYTECPYSKGAKTLFYKELLNQIEQNSPGSKLSFYTSFLKAKKQGFFNREDTRIKPVLTQCTSCSTPTSAPGKCAFCRLVERIPEQTKTTT
jgi:uncharacterized protein (TIGR00269 family)